jgi:hypothetical protein
MGCYLRLKIIYQSVHLCFRVKKGSTPCAREESHQHYSQPQNQQPNPSFLHPLHGCPSFQKLRPGIKSLEYRAISLHPHVYLRPTMDKGKGEGSKNANRFLIRQRYDRI